jgi:hypothetical protein
MWYDAVSLAIYNNNLTSFQALFDPRSLAFGRTLIRNDGKFAPIIKAVTVRNQLVYDLVIGSVVFAGIGSPNFRVVDQEVLDASFIDTLDNPCAVGTPLGVGDSCFLWLAYYPKSAGPSSATAIISYNGNPGRQTILLSGTAVNTDLSGPSMTVSPKSLQFGNQAIGTRSTETIMATNRAATLSGAPGDLMTFEGPAKDDFSVTPDGCDSMLPNEVCQIAVHFTPSAPGKRSATLAITSSYDLAACVSGIFPAPCPKALKVNLAGTGVVAVGATPASLAFGNQNIGTSSTTRTVTIKNNQDGILRVTSISVVGTNSRDFATTTTCASLLAGGTCTIGVRFSPTMAGAETASLKVDYAGTGGLNGPSGSQTTPLTGTGVAVRCRGQAPAIVSANETTFTIGKPGSFSVTPNCIPATLQLTGSLPAGIAFNPLNGLLSGTPGAGTAGTYTVTFTASNGVQPNATQSFMLRIIPAPTPPIITSANSATFTAGTNNTFSFTATGTPPISFAIQRCGGFGCFAAVLPAGLGFNTSNGVLSGNPPPGSTEGSYNFRVAARSLGGAETTQDFTLTIKASPAPRITSPDLVIFREGQAGSFTVTAQGTPTPVVTMTGTLPSGLAFNPSTRAISGTPAAGSAGNYEITFRASNGIGPDAVQSVLLLVSN